jgi:hypothetical protein
MCCKSKRDKGQSYKVLTLFLLLFNKIDICIGVGINVTRGHAQTSVVFDCLRLIFKGAVMKPSQKKGFGSSSRRA